MNLEAIYLILISLKNVYLYLNKMATPIKITPVLKGKSAVRFTEQLLADEKNKVSASEKARIFSLVERILSKSKYASK
jgi:hypothetical protein